MEPKSGLEVGTRLKHEYNFFAFFVLRSLFFLQKLEFGTREDRPSSPPYLARFNYQHVPNRDLDRSVVQTSQNFFWRFTQCSWQEGKQIASSIGYFFKTISASEKARAYWFKLQGSPIFRFFSFALATPSAIYGGLN